jgi:hypothetical protein
MSEGMAATHGALTQDQADRRIWRAWPPRNPTAQQRDVPGYVPRRAHLPLLGRQRQGRREWREPQKLRRYVARDLGSDQRYPGPVAVDDRNHAEPSDSSLDAWLSLDAYHLNTNARAYAYDPHDDDPDYHNSPQRTSLRLLAEWEYASHPIGGMACSSARHLRPSRGPGRDLEYRRREGARVRLDCATPPE